MENNNTEITQNPQPLFSRAFAYDGRIRRLEYCLSFVIGVIIVIATVYLPEYIYTMELKSSVNANKPLILLERSTTMMFVNLLCEWIFCITCWFMLAQSTKRCHDIGETGWMQFIPIYNLKLFFVKSNSDVNRYGYPPKKRISVDSNLIHKNIIKENNTLVTVYLLVMIFLHSDLLTQIAQFIRTSDIFHYISFMDLLILLIYNSIKFISLIGFVLVFHYKKIGFYIATMASSILLLLSVYYTSNSSSEESIGLYQIFLWTFRIIGSFGFLALFPILNIRKNGESVWEKMEPSLKNTDWKSFLLYLFTFQIAMLFEYLAHILFRILN